MGCVVMVGGQMALDTGTRELLFKIGLFMSVFTFH